MGVDIENIGKILNDFILFIYDLYYRKKKKEKNN